MDAEADTPDSTLSSPLRVALVVAVLATIAAAYWFVWRTPLEAAMPAADGGSASTSPAIEQDGVPGEPGTAESMASSLAAGQELDGEPVAGDEFASIDEVTLDLGDGQETLLRSGSGGTLAIRELSVADKGISEVLGGRITLVSLNEPIMLMLDSGERFEPGSRMPSGHVVAAIEREQIVLEREGVVSVIRLP